MNFEKAGRHSCSQTVQLRKQFTSCFVFTPLSFQKVRMESEDILLRQPSHMQTVIHLLNDQRFAEAFGDIKLVFADGDLFYYKALGKSLNKLETGIEMGLIY